MMAMTMRGAQQPWRLIGWSLAGALLLVPAVAMRFTDEVKWDAADFLFATVMIGGTGLAFEWALRRFPTWASRAGAALALLAMVGLVWVNGAVGIIGDEGNPANLLYGAVIAIVLLGGAVARLRPAGLAVTMLTAALAQAAIGAVAVVGRMGADGPIWPWDTIGATGLFTALWLSAAALFRRAAIISGG